MNYIEELEEIKKELQSDKLTYKTYLKYYKIAFLLNDKTLFEILSNVIPQDLTEITEERFGELDAKLRMRLAKY